MSQGEYHTNVGVLRPSLYVEVFNGYLSEWGSRGHPELAHEVNDISRLVPPWTLSYHTVDYNDGARPWASS
jgi:hypothetical protein